MNYSKLMQERLLDVINPDVDYSQEDFDNEFQPRTVVSMPKFNLGFVNKSNNEDPCYATKGSSGFDLRANITEPITIEGGDTKIIPTGLFFDIPENFEIQIRPRSGLSAKHAITVTNSPGTIDSDFTGEIHIILSNLSNRPFVVNHGDRIAQGVFASVIAYNWVSLNKLTEINKETERGAGGFGHTGIN